MLSILRCFLKKAAIPILLVCFLSKRIPDTIHIFSFLLNETTTSSLIVHSEKREFKKEIPYLTASSQSLGTTEETEDENIGLSHSLLKISTISETLHSNKLIESPTPTYSDVFS